MLSESVSNVSARPVVLVYTTWFYEVMNNSVEMTLAGFCDTSEDFTIHMDDSITVMDRRGIPTGMHKEGRSAAEVMWRLCTQVEKFGQFL